MEARIEAYNRDLSHQDSSLLLYSSNLMRMNYYILERLPSDKFFVWHLKINRVAFGILITLNHYPYTTFRDNTLGEITLKIL